MSGTYKTVQLFPVCKQNQRGEKWMMKKRQKPMKSAFIANLNGLCSSYTLAIVDMNMIPAKCTSPCRIAYMSISCHRIPTWELLLL